MTITTPASVIMAKPSRLRPQGDLILGANSFPANDNDEIFVFRRTSETLAPEGASVGTISQVTLTPRGPINAPIYNKNSTISGDGTHVVFSSYR
jgi:hypothetical protein